jgi:ribonuclease P protein component
MDYTFPRSQRLKTPTEFKHVWDNGRRLSGDCVAGMNCANNLGHARLGLSLSKKQFKRAVDRNRIKRIARETFRHIQSELGGRDVIILAYKGIEKLPPQAQHKRFEALWKRLIDICNRQS